MAMIAGAGLALGGCRSADDNPRFFWRVGPEQRPAFVQAQNVCKVELAKVQAPYLAADDPIQAEIVGREVWVACLRGKGYVLSRTENG